MDSLIRMNLIQQATKLAIYIYHKVIVIIIMNSMVQILQLDTIMYNS